MDQEIWVLLGGNSLSKRRDKYSYKGIPCNKGMGLCLGLILPLTQLRGRSTELSGHWSLSLVHPHLALVMKFFSSSSVIRKWEIPGRSGI